MLTLEQKIDLIKNSKNLGELPLDAMPLAQTDEYYFVSYSHLDYKEVYTDILRLQSLGLNVWYDRGLPAGKSWEEMAEEAVSKHACIGVIFYMSENALSSDAIKNEIEFVLKKKKDFLSINLPISRLNGEKVTLSADKMIDEIAKKNPDVLSGREIVDRAFSNKVIYLAYEESADFKVEKIKLLKRAPLIEYELVPSLAGSDLYTARVKMVRSIDVRSAVIPEFVQIGGKSYYVGQVGACAFANCKNLEQITFESESISIGVRAFFGCSDLSVVNATSLASIEEYAFCGCERLCKIPPLRGKVFERAFEGCIELKQITVEECFEYQKGAFTNARIEDINCSNSFYSFTDGCLVRGSGDVNKGESRVVCYTHPNEQGVLKIPYGTTSLMEGAVAIKDRLKILQLPYTLRKIGEEAFAYCTKLESVQFYCESGDKDEAGFRLEICDGAFLNCQNLHSITFPKHLEIIGANAFLTFNEGLKEVVFESDCKLHTIRGSAFDGCSHLKRIRLPQNLLKIGMRCFADCHSLDEVVFEGDRLIEVGSYAFSQCRSLPKITLPNATEEFGEGVFSGCANLREMHFGKNCSIKKLQANTFAGCGLREVTLPSSLVKIGEMQSLYVGVCKITFDYPSQLKKIEAGSFFPCFDLKQIVFGGSIAQWREVKQKYSGDQLLENSYEVICTDGRVTGVKGEV